MIDPQHEIRLWMKENLEAMGHGSKSRLAMALNVKPDAVTRMLNTSVDQKEVRAIKAHELSAMVRFFGKELPGTTPTTIQYVPIMGFVGASPDGLVSYAMGDGNFGEIEAPKDASPTTQALEVRGNSMYGLVNDGYIIFYEDREAPSEKHLGNLCVCFLEDDRVLVKIPQRGSKGDLFHLESVNAPMMHDVPVKDFAIVTDIKTKYAAQKFARRNPHAPIEDITESGQRV
jgi:phage repressor protein C with HTH and peptisase S24 domain